MVIDMVKLCRRCGATDRNPSGQCRPCKAAQHVKYYAEHAEQAKAYSAKWRAEHPERRKDYGAKYRDVHAGQVKDYGAKYRSEHYDQVRDYNAQYRTEHPDKIRALTFQYRTEHPESIRACYHKRRARKLKAGGSFTAAEIKALLKQQKKKCPVCGVNISKSYHIDHIMPLALGGHNGITNIQLLCPFCNLSKQDKHPVDFMQSRGFLL